MLKQSVMLADWYERLIWALYKAGSIMNPCGQHIKFARNFCWRPPVPNIQTCWVVSEMKHVERRTLLSSLCFHSLQLFQKRHNNKCVSPTNLNFHCNNCSYLIFIWVLGNMALDDVRSLGSLPSVSPRISHFLLWKKETKMTAYSRRIW
jgi:hypothetical protein